MSDFEDKSTSESEIEGDSSDSSEYAPEQQYQVRTDSNIQILLPKETVSQNATKHALLADERATTSGDKVYPEDEKNSWVRLDEDTGPPNIYRFDGSCWNYMDLNNSPQVQFLLVFWR